ncbi:MAG TPA: hypothetical protein VEB60_02660 [Candidatus Paceibacterota bacterium]|nr:hypothetical protein [Candidatus Paceibacterota bacterium]
MPETSSFESGNSRSRQERYSADNPDLNWTAPPIEALGGEAEEREASTGERRINIDLTASVAPPIEELDKTIEDRRNSVTETEKNLADLRSSLGLPETSFAPGIDASKRHLADLEDQQKSLTGNEKAEVDVERRSETASEVGRLIERSGLCDDLRTLARGLEDPSLSGAVVEFESSLARPENIDAIRDAALDLLSASRQSDFEHAPRLGASEHEIEEFDDGVVGSLRRVQESAGIAASLVRGVEAGEGDSAALDETSSALIEMQSFFDDRYYGRKAYSGRLKDSLYDRY